MHPNQARIRMYRTHAIVLAARHSQPALVRSSRRAGGVNN
jgi:hypothetical protein